MNLVNMKRRDGRAAGGRGILLASLMGLLLGASPHRRQELARRWSVEGSPDTGYLATNLYRRITDECFLRSFLDQLPTEQLMALEQVVGEPGGRLTLVQLLWRLPLDEARLQSAGAGLAMAGLMILESNPPCLVVPDDLLAPLRRLTRQRAETSNTTAAGRLHAPGSAEAEVRQHRFGELRGVAGIRATAARRATPLVVAGEPETLTTAGDSLLEDIDGLLGAAANGMLSLPGAAGDARVGPAALLKGPGRPQSDRLALARVSYALRSAVSLGLVVPDEGKGYRTQVPAVRAWRDLDRERQARAVYEVWVSDRDWQEPLARSGAGRARKQSPRFDRIRHRLRLWLADARPGAWYSIRSLLGRARGASNAGAAGNRLATTSTGGAILAVLTIGFRWLGGVDIGGDARGRAYCFRLTARGARLLRQPGAAIVATGDAARMGR